MERTVGAGIEYREVVSGKGDEGNPQRQQDRCSEPSLPGFLLAGNRIASTIGSGAAAAGSGSQFTGISGSTALKWLIGSEILDHF